MKEIVLDEPVETINIRCVTNCSLVIAKKNGEIAGMAVSETEGCILRTSLNTNSNGWHKTLKDLIEANKKHGYTFYVK